MKRAARLFAVLAIGVLATVMVSLILYDQLVFRPQMDRINQELAKAEPANRHPPPLAIRLLSSAEEFDAVVFYAATRLLTDAYPAKRDSPLFQPLDQYLWSRMLRFHYTEVEIIGLYCSIASSGDAQGLDQVSRGLYNLSPRDLEPEQLAFALASLRSPHLLKRDQARLEQHAQKMLRKIEAAPGN